MIGTDHNKSNFRLGKKRKKEKKKLEIVKNMNWKNRIFFFYIYLKHLFYDDHDDVVLAAMFRHSGHKNK